MSKERLTGKRAVWFGLLGTPVLLVAAITLIGVTAGSAGPAKGAKASAASASADGFTAHQTGESIAAVSAFWTPEMMESAQPYPQRPVAVQPAPEGSIQTIPQASGPPGLAMMGSDGNVDVQRPTVSSTGALTEPVHADIPYTQWQWFGRYLRNVPAGNPNLAIGTISKMFFQQDHDGNGTVSSFVCSASTIGTDAVWTAGHCLHNGLNGAGANDGFSTSVLFCPSYDSAQGGVNPSRGCWGTTDYLVHNGWIGGGDFDVDFAASDSNFPAIAPAAGTIGSVTGSLGLAWNWGNVHWLSFGYPAVAPFPGGKIETCASSLGYPDNGGPSSPDSVAMGCDMTGGTSGGPWIFQFGRFGGQPGGGGGNFLNGHNSWRHIVPNEPEELNTPYFNCTAVLLYNLVNETSVAC